jgi:hypothetical protein
VVAHRLHELLLALLPHPERAPKRQRQFLCLERRARCERRRRHLSRAIQGYTNIISSYYFFDLSLGYNTLDGPANEYLRNIGVQLVVQNIFDRQAAYGYRIATGGGNPCTCDIINSLQGRTISLIVTKEW